MTVFKCKMCGGDLEVHDDGKTCRCMHCDREQTLPNTDDDRIRSQYDRANALRLKSEFDRAEKIYTEITQESPNDPEGYWGLILCRYGIEYVNDPKTGNRIPTCHRVSFESVIADEDYKKALEFADISQKILYENQAKEIDEVQQRILSISREENPYDIFICYKETDENGSRTEDSVIGNDLYYRLSDAGFRVFFSAITLEDKLGQDYEPYIFSALNSAKVMLVLGTKNEFFNAVWVRNEWSRFLKLLKNDRSRLLIPCYKNLDPYDLPDEFAHLQALDMGKIGFISDLIRGVKKIIQPETTTKQTSSEQPTVVSSSANTASLEKRMFMSIEDGKWEDADTFSERILDVDAENAIAYLGKLMIKLNVRKRELLSSQDEILISHKEFQRAIDFSSGETRQEIESYSKGQLYNIAFKYLEQSDKSANDYLKTANIFLNASGYKDADEQKRIAMDEYEKLISESNDKLCESAKQVADSTSIPEIDKMIEELSSLNGWGESKEIIQNLLDKKKSLIRNRVKDALHDQQIPIIDSTIDLIKSISNWDEATDFLKSLEQEKNSLLDKKLIEDKKDAVLEGISLSELHSKSGRTSAIKNACFATIIGILNVFYFKTVLSVSLPIMLIFEIPVAATIFLVWKKYSDIAVRYLFIELGFLSLIAIIESFMDISTILPATIVMLCFIIQNLLQVLHINEKTGLVRQIRDRFKTTNWETNSEISAVIKKFNWDEKNKIDIDPISMTDDSTYDNVESIKDFTPDFFIDSETLCNLDKKNKKLRNYIYIASGIAVTLCFIITFIINKIDNSSEISDEISVDSNLSSDSTTLQIDTHHLATKETIDSTVDEEQTIDEKNNTEVSTNENTRSINDVIAAYNDYLTKEYGTGSLANQPLFHESINDGKDVWIDGCLLYDIDGDDYPELFFKRKNDMFLLYFYPKLNDISVIIDDNDTYSFDYDFRVNPEHNGEVFYSGLYDGVENNSLLSFEDLELITLMEYSYDSSEKEYCKTSQFYDPYDDDSDITDDEVPADYVTITKKEYNRIKKETEKKCEDWDRITPDSLYLSLDDAFNSYKSSLPN